MYLHVSLKWSQTFYQQCMYTHIHVYRNICMYTDIHTAVIEKSVF